MKVRLYGKNIGITTSMEVLVNKKLVLPIGRLLSNIDVKTNVQCDIEIRKRSVRNADIEWLCEAQVTVPERRLPIRVSAVGASLEAAINEAKDGIERRIKKFKGKRQTRTLRGARRAKEALRMRKRIS
ncbi:MAG: HPF/RaiA family ribosome-associated protein [bacterium]|nr:HPF/RaiA family ribosome-associated protein [bacterium]